MLWEAHEGQRVLFWAKGAKEPMALRPAGALGVQEMYAEQMRHWLACLRGEEVAEVSGQDGRRVIEVVSGVSFGRRSAYTDEIRRNRVNATHQRVVADRVLWFKGIPE